MRQRSDPQPPVQAVTSAPSGYSEDVDRRIHRYIFSMAIRTACVLLVVVIDHPVRWVFAVGAVFLPYIAVVMANAGRPQQRGNPMSVDLRALPLPAPRAPHVGADPERLDGPREGP